VIDIDIENAKIVFRVRPRQNVKSGSICVKPR